ncbi:MAG TPA: insulinase family protein [Longimicrobium sp.]|nr:insulinase family protein [Longimicrobium sp.]
MRRTLLLLALLTGWAAAAAAQPAGTAGRARSADAALMRPLADTALRTGRLSNGLTYFVRPDPDSSGRAELRLVIGAGSALEDADQHGVAHLLEHMAFTGTRRFGRDEIVGYLERLGMRYGADLNAYTDRDATVYRLTVPTDVEGALEHGLDVMADWAWAITLDSAELARERGVVIEEWRSERGAQARIDDREEAFLWAGSPYARPVIGDPDAIRASDVGRVARFYRDWYRPELAAVVAVGDFDPARVEQLIRDGFGAWPSPAAARPLPPPPSLLGRGARYLVTPDPELANAAVSVCWMRSAAPLATLQERLDDVGMRVGVSMLNRRLALAATRPGAPFVGAVAWHDEPVRAVRLLCLSAQAPAGGAVQALAAVLAEAERAARDGFTDTEYERERSERSRLSFDALLGGVQDGETADAYAEAFLAGRTPVMPGNQTRFDNRALRDITVNEASARTREWMRAPDRVVLVSVPGAAGAPLPAEERLAQVADSVAAAPLEAYAETATAGVLMAHTPKAGRIVREDSIPEIGVWRWTLSNGLRVVLRPDTTRRRVHLVATSRGGLSRVPDSLFVHALLAPIVVQAGGLGGLSAEDLERTLEGRRVELQPFLDAWEEGVRGSSSGGYLDVLFQLVHLHFTAPRVDTAAWNVTAHRVLEILRAVHADPTSALGDTLRALLGTEDPRERSIVPDDVMRVDPARAVAVFRERFANASDFTVYLVGDLNPQAVRPAVERYLASLPGSGARELPRDLGNRLPAGVSVRTVRAGREAVGVVVIVFSGEAPFTREARSELESMAMVLEGRLQTRLREELGLVYDQAVMSNMGARPVPWYHVTIGVPAAPERLEEVAGVVFAVVDSLRAHGATDDEVLRVREAARRAHEEQLRDNAFWADELRTADENGWDPRAIDDPPPSATLTPERVRKAVRAYLAPDRYVQVMLVPADADTPPP